MDATNLGGQVKDLVQNLASSETYKHANAVRTTFAPDAVLTTPVYKTSGTENIRDMVNLHHALTSECAVSGVEWDDKAKTATFALSSTYSLVHAPFPLSLLRIFAINVKTPDVTVALQPDESHPVRSDATEPTRYLVSRVTAPAHPPKSRIIAAVYPVILFVVRLVAPIMIDTLVVVHKFFVRHPLKDGVFRTATAAVCEIVGWALGSVRSHLPFIGRPAAVADKNERADPTTDVPSIPSSPVVTSAPLPARKAEQKKAEQKKVEPKEDKKEDKKAEKKEDKKEEVKKEDKEEVKKEDKKAEVKEERKPEVKEDKKAEVKEERKPEVKEDKKAEVKEEPKPEVKEDKKAEAKEEPKAEVKEEPKAEVKEPAEPEKSEDDVVQDKIEAKLAEIEKKHENKPKVHHKKEHKEHKGEEHKAEEHKTEEHTEAEPHHLTFADVTANEPAVDAHTAQDFPTLAATTGELSAVAPPPHAVDPNSESTFANVAEAAPPSVSSEAASSSPSEESSSAAAQPNSTANGNKSSKNKKKSNKKGARK